MTFYQNSVVTISAARAASASQGFLGLQTVLGPSDSFATVPVASPLAIEGEVGAGYLCLKSSWNVYERSEPPIIRRAWTHQEFLLSLRVIRFLGNGLDLCCPAGTVSNDRLHVPDIEKINPISRNPRLPAIFYHGRGQIDAYRVENLWYHIVEQYSSAQLSFTEDRLLALAGIAAVFQRATGSAHLVGMWEDSLTNALLWRTGSDVEAGIQSMMTRRYRIPSWSWASREGRCNLALCRLRLSTTQLDVLESEVNLVQERLPLGQVDGGYLIVRGRLRPIPFQDAQDAFDKRMRAIDRLYPDYDWHMFQASSDRPGMPAELTFLCISDERWEYYPGARYRLAEYGLVLGRLHMSTYERVGAYMVEGSRVEDWMDGFARETIKLV